MEKSHITSMRLFWDCEFYYRLLLGSIEANKIKGVSTFLSSLILRECTVFVQEMAAYEPSLEKGIVEETSNLFKSSYQAIRDRIHYFTSNPFDYTAEQAVSLNMMAKIQKSYLTRPIDDMASFRYDLSYLKAERSLCCSSIDLSALLESTPIVKNGKIIGPALQQYSFDLARIIANVRSGFADSELSGLIRLDDLQINGAINNLSFFDGKFDVAISRTGLSEFLTIILLRLLSDTGSILFTVKCLFDPNWVNSYHLYFFTRLLAIRFDEISDALYRIENGFPPEEARGFLLALKSNGIYPFSEELRQVAKRLRNSIHYNASSEIWSFKGNQPFYWTDNFLKQASVDAFPLTRWPDDYLDLKDKMLKHLEALRKWLEDIFDYDLKFVNSE